MKYFTPSSALCVEFSSAFADRRALIFFLHRPDTLREPMIRIILFQSYKSRRSPVCDPTESECNHFRKKMYVINPKNTLEEWWHTPVGDYILAYARLHTNPSDWIKKDSQSAVFFWSGWWESNPRDQLGRLGFYHWTTPANINAVIISENLRFVNRNH